VYLFIVLFNEDILKRGRIFHTGAYLEQIKSIFPDYKNLNESTVKGCIGILKGKDNSDKSCYLLRVNKIKAENASLTIQFETEKELDTTNSIINKSLYKFAIQSNWINKENEFYPSVCVVGKNDFDSIRKGTTSTRKISSYTAKIDELKIKKDWLSICNLYEPLEKIHEIDEIWNNVYDLYNVGFACSKLGEPQNGLEKDDQHLSFIKRYRDHSTRLFKRCCELEPKKLIYPSSLAYRYYQNVMELTKPKGRRDGNVEDEIANAIKYLNESLLLNPDSIKDNYRKGKLIIDKQIPRFKYSQKNWDKGVFDKLTEMEASGIGGLKKCVEQYEKLTYEDQKQRYLKEYVKSLYCLGCYYIEKPRNLWFEYACSNLVQAEFTNNMTGEEMEYIIKAKEVLEKCFEIEANTDLRIDMDARQLANMSKHWTISSMDKLYRLGVVYLNLFFIQLTKSDSVEPTNTYGEKAKAYLNMAKLIGEEYRKSGFNRRNTSFISEKLAWYYIFIGDYDKAIKLIDRSLESYIKNTLSVALMLSGDPDSFSKSENSLQSAGADKYNMAKDISIALLAYQYKLSDQVDKYDYLLTSKKDNLSSYSKKLISILESGDIDENR
jgi:hypothetical protein